MISRATKIFNKRGVRQFASLDNVKHVGVVGAGQMGSGIGIVASAVAGLEVTFVDPSEESLKRSESFIEKWCDKEMKKERMTAAEKVTMISRIKFGDTI